MNTQPLNKQTKAELIRTIGTMSAELAALRTANSMHVVQIEALLKQLGTPSEAPSAPSPASEPEETETPRSPWQIAKAFGQKYRMCQVSVMDGIPVYRSMKDPTRTWIAIQGF